MKLLQSIVCLLCAAAPLTVEAAEPLAGKITAYRRAHEAAIVGQLDELTQLRSVAAEPAGLIAAAERLMNLLKARGFDVRLLTTAPGAPPVVFAQLTAPKAKRTVTFYAHYDGQPVTPSEWHSDAFVPVMRGPDGKDVDWKTAKAIDPDWRLYGRAAGDDKASIVAFLAAFDALKAVDRKPSVNIKVVWEGEEERNSVHLESVLRANQALLASDLWLIGDGPLHQSRTPTIYFGARGSMGAEATVYGPLRALHDGHYGNWVPNPAAMAADLISSLRDADGHILIPGFADDVRPLNAAETKAIAALPAVEDDLKKDFGIGRSEGAEGLTASTMRPAINVRGLRSGQVGASAANAIPVDAAVSFDFRLVPDQTPEGVRTKVENYLKSKGWTVTHDTPDTAARMAAARLVKLSWGDGYPALRSAMDSPAAKAVIASAGRAAGQPVAVLPMMGGSVPITMFADVFKVPVIGLPVANHDNSQHAADENLRLGNLWDGINTYAGLMGDLTW